MDDNHDDSTEIEKAIGKTKRRTKARKIRSVWFNKQAESEKHYRELLMLFTPWRNEETDLIGMCSSYQDRYMLLSNAINDQMKQYAVCNQDFNEIQKDMGRIEDRYGDIAPCTESLEQQDQAEGDHDLHSDFTGNYNLLDDLGTPSVDNTEPLIMNELPDDEYRYLVQKLNKEQKEFFYHILYLIKTANEAFYCFLSGDASVGKKSHVTKALY